MPLLLLVPWRGMPGSSRTAYFERQCIGILRYRHIMVKEVAFPGSSIFRIVALLRLNESELCVEEYP